MPPELTSFVGRAEELAALGPALAAGRLLTLVGPGGCGKTRLAIRLGQEAAGGGSDGGASCWVGLEEEPDPERVGRRVAEALDVLAPAGLDPVPAVVAALRDRKLLIVLDNCEHVPDGAARLVAAILAGCPGVTVLATSRAPLGVPGERVWRVPPMSLADALALFLERSRAADGAGARRLCDRLDRLPLALELAAGWAGTLSAAQIADSLGSPFALLEGGARTAPFRQQTLEGSMRWSHDLLDEDERVLFRRLAVFEPGFGAAAVSALTERNGLRALRGLVDKSLVVADTTGSEAAYRMLGVVRAYAMDRLTEAGEADELRDRHLDLYLDLVERLAPLLTTDKDEWRARIGAAYPNLRAAIEWGLSREDPSRGRRLAAACAWLWHLEGRGGEGVRLLRRAADRGADERTPLQADVLAAYALVADTGLPGTEAYQVAYAARQLAVETGAPAAARISRALTAIGRLMVGLDGALDEAQAARAEALAAGDVFVADSAEAFIGVVHVLADRYPEAIKHLEAAVAGPLARGDRGVAALAQCWLALATARSGDLRRAGELAERAVETAAPLRDFHWTGSTRCVLAEIRVLQGRVAEAWRALEPIDALLGGELPYITGWERTKALLALESGRPAEAVEWCRLEGRWQPAPSEEGLAPETRLVLATALRLAGDHEAAARTLQALENAPLTPAMPRIRAGVLDEQALLAHDGDPERALRLHREAMRIRADHDLVLGFRAAAAYAAKARGPRRRPDAGWASLTPAELSVVELAVQGLSNVEIGARLFIGRGTVKTHLAHVYAKLQVANRTELARLAAGHRSPLNLSDHRPGRPPNAAQSQRPPCPRSPARPATERRSTSAAAAAATTGPAGRGERRRPATGGRGRRGTSARLAAGSRGRRGTSARLTDGSRGRPRTGARLTATPTAPVGGGRRLGSVTAAASPAARPLAGGLRLRPAPPRGARGTATGTARRRLPARRLRPARRRRAGRRRRGGRRRDEPPLTGRQLGQQRVTRPGPAGRRAYAGLAGQIPYLRLLIVRHQRDHRALRTRPRRPAGPVHVGLVLHRRVRVDHQRHVVDVDAPGRDVGRHQRLCAPVGERRQVAVARVLRQVPVQLDRRHPGRHQLLGQHLRPPLGAGEDHRTARRGQQVDQHAEPVVPAYVQHVVGHLGRHLVDRVDRVRHRPPHEALDQHVDPVVQGRREEQPLPVPRGLLEQPSDHRQEAQVGHVVGLVEHGDLDRVQRGVAVAQVVVEPAGAGHQHIDAGRQPLDLRVRADATEDDQRAQAERGGERREGGVDLAGQLAGGRQDQRAGTAGAPGAARGGQAGQHGQRERVRLAGAGAPAAQDVPSGERVGQGGGLDRERGGDAERGQRLGEGGRDAELGECGHVAGTPKGWGSSQAIKHIRNRAAPGQDPFRT